MNTNLPLTPRPRPLPVPIHVLAYFGDSMMMMEQILKRLAVKTKLLKNPNSVVPFPVGQ